MADQSEARTSRAHLFISGRVQGVSFRWYTHRMAHSLGLTGWVRNVRDGRVEAIFEGPKELVQKAVAWCHHGEPPARVDDVQVSYADASGEFNSFRITW